MGVDIGTAAAVGAAAVAVSYAMGFLKLAWPAAPGWALVLVALLSGVGASIGLAYSSGAIVDARGVVAALFQGFIAAAGAAGLTRTDSAGERARIAARADSARAAMPGTASLVSIVTASAPISQPDPAPADECGPV